MAGNPKFAQDRRKGGHPPGVGKHPTGVGGHWLMRWKRSQAQKGKKVKVQAKRTTAGTPGQLARAVLAPPSFNVRALTPPTGAASLSTDASGSASASAPPAGSASATTSSGASTSTSPYSSTTSTNGGGSLSAGAIAGIAIGAAAGLLLLVLLVLYLRKRSRLKGATIGRVSANRKSTRGYARRGPNSAVVPTVPEEEDTFEQDMIRWMEGGGGGHSGRLFPHSQIKKSLNRIPSGSEPLGCTNSGTLVFHEGQKPSPLPRPAAVSAPVSPLRIVPLPEMLQMPGTSAEAPASLPPPAAQSAPAFGVAPLSLVHDSLAEKMDV